MRYFQRSISYFTSFFSKDCTKKSFLCCQFCLSLRSNFADKNISCTNLSTDTDNTSLIQIFQCIITYAWNITCNFFWSELCITGFCFIFFDMNRCVNIILYKTFTKKYSILVVVTFPGHKSDQRVLTKSHLTIGGRWSVCDYLSLFNSFTFNNNRSLVVAVALVASQEFGQLISLSCLVILFNCDFGRC